MITESDLNRKGSATMRGHHAVSLTHPTLHLNETSNKILIVGLWALATVALFIVGVVTAPISMAGSLTLIGVSMATGVCSTHAFHGGRFLHRKPEQDTTPHTHG